MPFDNTDFQIDTPVYPDDAEWRRVLWKAADYIAEHGWCQNDICNDATGEVCAMGAILGAIGKPLRTGIYTRPAMEAATHLEDRVGMWAAVWNDTPGRTAEEVISALRECALC